MPAIHLIERLGNYQCVDKVSNEWESGYWVVAEDTAAQLVGGQLYLHDAQDKPSRFGGDILSFRVHRGGDQDGRVVFRFKPTPHCKNVRAGRDAWGNEKKIVW